MVINADVGEMTGSDGVIMPCITMGNVACGGHASDGGHMAETVRLAVRNGVRVCAHPGYRDVENFGRVSVELCKEDVVALMEEQVGLLRGICEEHGVGLFAIKPHGALYHDMMCKVVVRDAVVSVAKRFGVPLVVQALVEDDVEWGVEVMREVFADRGYRKDGSLVPRSEVGALLLDDEVILAQARLLMGEGRVVCVDGEVIELAGDTICFHGDHAASVSALKKLC